MSVMIFDENNIISIPVSSEGYFCSVLEKAIQELGLRCIGNSRQIHYDELPQIMDEFVMVRFWAEKNLHGAAQDYVILRINQFAFIKKEKIENIGKI